jgi:putative transcriptional regulator
MRNLVRELRATRDLSQDDLAKLLNVSRQTVNSIERNRYSPSLQLAITIARLFNTTVEEVFLVDAPQPADAQ